MKHKAGLEVYQPGRRVFFFTGLIILALNFNSILYSRDIPFSTEDRDRMIRLEIRLEEGLKSLQKQIDDLKVNNQTQFDGIQTQFDGIQRQFDGVQRQFDDIKTFMLWGFGILFGGMGLLMGLVLWDRRTALSPVVRKSRELEEKEYLLEKTLKEYAKVEPKFAEILRSMHL